METGTLILLSGYCVLIILASLIGGWAPLWIKFTHQRMQLTISGIAGFMLGVAILHMLAHALEAGNSGNIMQWLLAGLLTMFFIERFFAFHQHEPAPEAHEDHEACCDHAHEHSPLKLSWTGAAAGMTLHSLIGGLALGSSVLAEAQGQHVTGLAGLAVFLVIVLHKPLDSMTVLTLAKAAGYSNHSAHLINILFALAVPAGAMLTVLGGQQLIDENPQIVSYALAFSAGTFLCIALGDLLPELHFHSHDRVKLSAALMIGLALAWGVGLLEHATHDHDHGSHAPHGEVDDPHAGHDHGDHSGHNH